MAASLLKCSILASSAIEISPRLAISTTMKDYFGFSRTCKYGTTSSSVLSEAQMSENDNVDPDFVNRNPRNLENMSLARKPKGFRLDYPTKQFYHKVFLEQSSRHITAGVRHFTGRTVVTASTQEWAIQKHLYSTNDVAAVKNVGRVLAQRCLESGIIHVHFHFTQAEENTNKVKLFKTALEDGGLSLVEPHRLYPLRPWD